MKERRLIRIISLCYLDICVSISISIDYVARVKWLIFCFGSLEIFTRLCRVRSSPSSRRVRHTYQTKNQQSENDTKH